MIPQCFHIEFIEDRYNKQLGWLVWLASEQQKILMSSSTLHNRKPKHIKMLLVIIATITEPNCFKDVMNCN